MNQKVLNFLQTEYEEEKQGYIAPLENGKKIKIEINPNSIDYNC
jgi:hypothetical protein